jgi:PEP-CTERM motif-containing protein
MNVISRFSRHALTATALAAAAACVPAAAQTFTVNEGSVPGAAANTLTADRISFNYAARIDQTLIGSAFDGNDPFTESGYLTKASFANGGSAVPSQLNGVSPAGYGIFGLFTITGMATQQGAGIHATFDTVRLQLFLDPGQDTTLSFVGNTATAGGSMLDDRLLMSYTLSSGEANVRGGLANGDFDTILNATPTADGLAFFTGPRPFYTLENFGGNTQTITGASLTSSFVATATGAGTELFMAPIPEPETYALMLAGLGALGFVARRRRRS